MKFNIIYRIFNYKSWFLVRCQDSLAPETIDDAMSLSAEEIGQYMGGN